MVTTIRFPDELHKALKAEAKEKGLTLNAYLISLLWNRIQKREVGEWEKK